MSVVESTIAARKAAGSGALIGYLPAGFPDLQSSIDAAVALAENGVDIIELGIPYSDPVMDGLVIQHATQQALEGGFRLGHAFEAVAAITSRVDAPVLVMTYFNPVFQYGVERFADDLVAAGARSLVIDMSEVDFVDSSGLRALIRARQRFDGPQPITILAPQTATARLLEITGLTNQFSVEA